MLSWSGFVLSLLSVVLTSINIAQTQENGNHLRVIRAHQTNASDATARSIDVAASVDVVEGLPCVGKPGRASVVRILASMRDTCLEMIRTESLDSLFCDSYSHLHEWAYLQCPSSVHAHSCDDECESYITGTSGGALGGWLSVQSLGHNGSIQLDADGRNMLQRAVQLISAPLTLTAR